MDKMKNRALIIDGNNFYTISYWSAQKKNDNNFIPIRFFEKLSEVYEVYKNSFGFLFIAWDSLINNRKKENSEYKGTRKEKPKDFYDMMPYIVDTLKMRMVQQYKVDGYEGDDIIYSIVEMCKSKNYPVTVASADHDMYQLIDSDIDIYDPYTRNIVNYDKFTDLYKIKPEQWKYVKSLMGDVADNIQGVKGIGEVNAIKIIANYKDLDGFYNSNMSQVSKSIREKMTLTEEGYNAKESAYNSLKMVEFRKVDLPYPELAAIDEIKINRSIYVENFE